MRDTLKTIPGVKSVDDVDYGRGRATVTIDTSKTSPEAVAGLVAEKSRNRYQATVVKP